MRTPHAPTDPGLSRRRFLAGTALATITTTAGCTDLAPRFSRPRAATWLAKETTALNGHFRALDPSTLPEGEYSSPAEELNWLLGIDLLSPLDIGVEDTSFAVTTYGLSLLDTTLDRETITARLSGADWSEGEPSMGATWLDAPDSPWTTAVLGSRVLLAQPDGAENGITARQKLADAIKTHRGTNRPRTATNPDLAKLVRTLDGADDAFGRTGPPPTETDEALGLFAGQVAMGTAYEYGGERTHRRRVYVFDEGVEPDLERMKRFNAEEARDRGANPAGVHHRGRTVVLRQTSGDG